MMSFSSRSYAPALTTATTGIAMGAKGTAISAEAAPMRSIPCPQWYYCLQLKVLGQLAKS